MYTLGLKGSFIYILAPRVTRGGLILHVPTKPLASVISHALLVSSDRQGEVKCHVSRELQPTGDADEEL